ncbi:MAG TPA: nuclear transport factor 2 family protein [Acidimicrobiales bacterium]|nr:nuclear transport factor 2 family protein [Acidimicrobiales bacterium]
MGLYEEVEAYGQRFAETYHAQDADALYNILDPECLLMNPGAPTVVGRDEVLARLTGHADPPPLLEFQIDHFIESGDLAIAVGTVVAAQVDEPLHRFLVVYRRHADGSLALLADVPIAGL